MCAPCRKPGNVTKWGYLPGQHLRPTRKAYPPSAGKDNEGMTPRSNRFIVLLFVGVAFFLLRDKDTELYEESLKERQKRNLEKMQKMQKRQNEETFKDGMKRIWNQTKTIFKKKEVTPHDSEA